MFEKATVHQLMFICCSALHCAGLGWAVLCCAVLSDTGTDAGRVLACLKKSMGRRKDTGQTKHEDLPDPEYTMADWLPLGACRLQ